MAWELIDTAPRDGSDVLVAVATGGRQLVARWNADLPLGGGWVAVDQVAVAPTHWQALPDPPGVEPPAILTRAKKDR